VVADSSEVLTRAPENIKVLYRRALAYESLSQYSECQDDINRLLRLDPTHKLALQTHERLQKVLATPSPPKPQATTNQIVPTPAVKEEGADDSSTSAWKLETMKKEALQYLGNGSVAKAVNVLQSALKVAQEDTTTDADQILSLQHLLASAHASQENYDLSLATAEEILKKNPNNFKALLRAGDSAFHLVSIFSDRWLFAEWSIGSVAVGKTICDPCPPS
jgi:tetratricopeptide (TPR) repeat protein